MARLFSPLRTLRRFRRADRGSLSVEAVMVFPLLIFAYAGLFTFFDAFRTENVNVRSSYTIADMLSRETNLITPEYVAGLNSVLGLLTRSDYPTILRVTVVTYDDINKRNNVVWSAVDGGSGEHILPLTNDTLPEIQDRIPMMADGDINIVVQTWSGFVPMMDFGLDAFYFEHLVVTRPRFAPNLCFQPGLIAQYAPCNNT